MIAELRTKEIIEYCENFSHQDSKILKELIAYTFKNSPAPQMISGVQVGNLLQSLIMLSQSKKILEIGMFTGYSALKMAEILPEDGRIHTCEIGENHIQTAQKFFDKSNHGHKITIHKGAALNTINKFELKSFDLCFIDADKNNYPNYFKLCTKLLKSNGCLILDNMLWGGEVLNPKDQESQRIADTAQLINENKDIYNTMLTIRDGLMLCVKK